MMPGDVVLTTKFEARSGGIAKPTMRATFKSNPGTAMVFIACGSVCEGEAPVHQAERVMEAMGWISPAQAEGDDAGIAAAFASNALSDKKGG